MSALHIVRDTDCLVDVRRQRDALLGALAELTAQSQAAPFGPTARERRTDRQQREDDAVVHWHGVTVVDSDDVDRWVEIARRADR